ncbi:hypothetical protein WA026_014773 [Henosepilachna vigintioctopunctata]|uniref:Uncharacterized protein n=1 Tax=Henosepilachna vigintioctopunctata TaxID=420089 RepID=A0AAW1UR77_9CUCU
MKKVKKFFHDHNSILNKRSPHLIRQWILRKHDKYLKPLAGQNSSRARWTTPERTVVEEVVNKHSAEDLLPSIPECEFLIEKILFYKKETLLL